VCAPKGTLPTSALDALVCLKAAVGQAVSLDCPCQATTTTTGNGNTTTTDGPTTTTTLRDIDAFNFPSACVELWIRQAFGNAVPVKAPGRVELFIDRTSMADRDIDGREDVVAEVFFVEFEAGSPAFGDVVVELPDPSIHPLLDHRTRGIVEETVNATPGELDLPPYAEAGSAEVTFDVYLQALVSGGLAGGRAHNDFPVTLRGLVSAAVPRPGELLVMQNTSNVPLLKDSDVSFFGLTIDAGNPATLDLNAASCE
jgi:hypothetical protein